jgi:hypothetical protein
MSDLTPTELTLDDLKTQLLQCQSERSNSAAYAVRLQDEASLLRTQVRELLQGVRHLMEHLENPEGMGGPNRTIFTPGHSCKEIHPLIKKYL